MQGKMELKRKFNDMSSCLKSSSGNGPRVEAIVFKRLAPKEKKSGAKKSPPTKLCIKVLSESVSIDYTKVFDDGDKGAASYELHQNDVLWVAVFDCSPEIKEGCIIVLSNPSISQWQDRVSITSGANVICSASFSTSSSLPEAAYNIPTLEEVETCRNVIIRVGVEGKSCAETYGVDVEEQEKTYVLTTKDGDTKLGAYIPSKRGYPFFFGDNCLMMVSLYENHLCELGVSDVMAWSKLASKFFNNLVCVICGYVDVEKTKALDINNKGGYNKSEEDDSDAYALSITASLFQIDLVSTVKKAGERCSFEEVAEHFENEPFLESEAATNNILFQNKGTSKIICLSEYTGKMSNFKDHEFVKVTSEDGELSYFYAIKN